MKEIELKIKEENKKLHDFGAENFDNYPKILLRNTIRDSLKMSFLSNKCSNIKII